MHFYIINITEISISINKVLINNKHCSVIENDSQQITKIGENRCILYLFLAKIICHLYQKNLFSNRVNHKIIL